MHATPGARCRQILAAPAEPSRPWLRRNFLMSHVLSTVLQMILRVLGMTRAARGWTLMRWPERCENLVQRFFAVPLRFQMELAKCSTAPRYVHEPRGFVRGEFRGGMAWPAVWGQDSLQTGMRGVSHLG